MRLDGEASSSHPEDCDDDDCEAEQGNAAMHLVLIGNGVEIVRVKKFET